MIPGGAASPSLQLVHPERRVTRTPLPDGWRARWPALWIPGTCMGCMCLCRPLGGQHTGPNSRTGPTAGRSGTRLGVAFMPLSSLSLKTSVGQRGDQSPTAGTDLKTQAFPGSRQGCSTARMKAVPGQGSLPCSSRSHTRRGLGKPAQHPGPSTQRRESGPGAGSHQDVRGRV